MSYTTFWNVFSKHADAWAIEMGSGSQRKVFDEIDSLLQSHDLQFCFDITTDEKRCVLIFSPEGAYDLARSIDELIGNAPNISTWRILNRRPQKDLNDASAIVHSLYLLDPMQMRYRIHEGKNGRVVDMIVPACSDLSPEEGEGMVNTFLWHAIGEGQVMERGVRGKVSFEDDPAEPTISAARLVEILS